MAKKTFKIFILQGNITKGEYGKGYYGILLVSTLFNIFSGSFCTGAIFFEYYINLSVILIKN